MSSFTKPLQIEAVHTERKGWKAFLPPSMLRPSWRVSREFTYAVGSLENPSLKITVDYGFVFDGATVPLPFRLILPTAHPDFIQAAALHDWLYVKGDSTRNQADTIFLEALSVLGIARVWRWSMFIAVRLFGWRYWYRRHGSFNEGRKDIK